MNLIDEIFGVDQQHTDAWLASRSKASSAPFSAAAPQRALLIQVRDVPKLVESKGGAAGAFAMKLAPETIASTVYGKMRDEFAVKLKEQGVDADVQVVSPAAYQRAGVAPAWRGAAIGLGAAAGGLAVWKIVDFFRRRRR